MRKSITFVSDYSLADPERVITGVMVQCHLLAKTFAVMGWSVHTLASTAQRDPVQHRDVVTLAWFPHRRFLKILSGFTILKRCRETGSSVYYQRGRDILTGCVALYCRLTGKTFIWASAGETGLERHKYFRQVMKKRRPWWIKAMLLPEAVVNDLICHFGIAHAHVIVVQTQTQRRRLRETFQKDAVVIQSGHEAPVDQVRTLPIKVLWIGSIKEVKQPEMFMKLAAASENMACEFWLAGQSADAKLGDDIKRWSASRRNVRFLGPIPFEDSARLIAQAHVLVNTTREGYEGLPNAFVQAWLAGTVVLTLHANPDDAIRREKLGFQCASIDEMVTHIRRWIERPDEWAELSENSRRYGRAHFSISTIARQLEHVIHENAL